MKNIILFLLCACLAPMAAAADTVQIDGVWYELNADGTAAVANQFDNTAVDGSPISQYYGLSGDIVIPESVSYDGTDYAVTALVDGACANQWKLTSIVIPASVTSMGSGVFSNSHVKKITVPEALVVPRVPDQTFVECEYLDSIFLSDADGVLTEFCLSEKITELGDSVFYNSTHYAVSVPVNVESVGRACFRKCTQLNELVLPDKVASIGDSCFMDCTHLASVVLPSGLVSLGDGCFEKCTVLTEIELPALVTSLGDRCFQECTALSTVKLPELLSSLSAYCFYKCTALSAIELPNSLVSLGADCFYDCTSLSSLTLPDAITELPDFCFYGCEALVSVNVPEGVTSIGTYCFDGCSSLGTVVLPSSLTEIGNEGFYRCGSLKSVTCKAVTPPALKSDKNFPADLEDCTLYVPTSSISTYAKSKWADYFDIFAEVPFVNVDPADGEEVLTLSAVTFSHDPVYADWSGLDETAVKIYDDAGELASEGKTGSAYETETSDGTPAITIDLETVVTEPGTYTISVPDSLFYNDENGTIPVMAFTSVVVVLGDDRPDLVLSPADQSVVTSLSSINVSYEGGIAWSGKVAKSKLTVTDMSTHETTTKVSGYTHGEETNAAGANVDFDLSLAEEITEPGEYKLTIPDGTFTLTLDDGSTTGNKETTVYYTVDPTSTEDGIDAVKPSEANACEVYNAVGQKLDAPVSGQVNIVRATDGMVKKVLTK